MLPRCVFSSPANAGLLRWREIQKLVKLRIRRWLAGEISELWIDVLSEKDSRARLLSRKKKKSTRNNLRKSNAIRARRAVEDGQYRKAIQALSSGGLAPITSDVVKEMQAKHPQSSPPSIPLSQPQSPIELVDTQVIQALRSFPNGSAPGPSNLRANHLKEAVSCPSPGKAARATQALTRVVSLLCDGRAPSQIVPHLCGATLLPIQKKGCGLRPIAVGEVLRRLTSKCLSKCVKDEAFQTLTPLQVGVGVKVGCETVVHAVSRIQEDPAIQPSDKWTLLLDFSNAFNSISRSHMFMEIQARIPILTPWMESCYGTQPFLHLGDHTILSSSGVQQGDPLGPLGFALTLQPIIERIRDEVPGLNINAWYLDDGTLCGSAVDLVKALKIVEDEGPSRGLHLNRSKSLLYIPAGDSSIINPLPSEIPTTSGGFCLLGSPIGPPSFCETSLQKRVDKVKDIITKLHDLEDSQMESTLLRSCLALPKVAFSLRSCPPSHIQHATAAFDETMLEALSDIAGSPLSEWARLKASLPSSMGGLNIRKASLHAPAAYISSLAECRVLLARILGRVPKPCCHLPSAVSALSSASCRQDWVSLDQIDVPLRQKALSHCIDEASLNQLLVTAPNNRCSALALSTSLPHAGDWLNVIPSSALGLHLHDKEFRLCLDYWLGLRMDDGVSPCSACGITSDAYGDHQVGCGGNGDRIHRHDAVKDVLFSAAQSAALAPTREAPSLISGSCSRPADIFLPTWKRGMPAALDVHVISPLQLQTKDKAAIIQGHALKVGEQRKMAAHGEECKEAGINFIPIVVETLGGWSSEAIQTIADIGRLQGQCLGITPGDSIRHLFQRLAISLWRGNATLWLNRLSTSPPRVDGFV